MTKNSFTNVIEELYNHKSIAEIYAYSHDSDKFAVGIVIDYSLEEVVIQAIDNFGFKDGIFIGRTKDIYRISIKTTYIDSIRKLYEHNYIKDDNCAPVVPLCGNNNKKKLYDLYITHLLRNSKIVTCTLYNGVSLTGIIESYTNQVVKMKIYNQVGLFDGVSFFDAIEIETLSFDSSEEIKFSKLISNHIWIPNSVS